MRHNRATPELCPPPARREFLAGLVGVTAAAGVTVAAAASSDPDADILAAARAVLDLRAEQNRAVRAWDAAEARASAAYPPELPAWPTWADANHPRGPFMKPGVKDSAGRAALVALFRALPSRQDGQIDARQVDWLGQDGEMIADGMVKAEREYYAEIRPRYDAMAAERDAAVAAIDRREGLPELDRAIVDVERRHDEALAALLVMQPATASGFVRKLAALAFYADPDKIAEAIAADSEALIAEGRA